METKDRWWLGSASLSGEEYPYLLRKLEYWGTTFNNASLTTKASQLRLPLPAHPPQPFRYVIDQIFTYHPLTSTIRSKRKVKGLSKTFIETFIETSGLRTRSLTLVSFPSVSRNTRKRCFQFRVERVSIDHRCILNLLFLLLFFFFLTRIVHSTKERLFSRHDGTWSDSIRYPPDLLAFILIPPT